MSKRNCSTCNSILLSLHWDKTSDSRSAHRLDECQKSHQQLRKNAQTDQMIHSAADSVTVQFDWETAVWEWRERAEIVNNLMCEFKNKREVWRSLSSAV